MNVKAIVKVMNFHALLRVDSARKLADNYGVLEEELSAMIDIIINNRNFQLDKRIMKPKAGMPELNLYFGSDYGFCGGINSAISSRLMKDTEKSTTVSVGKKLRHRSDVNVRMASEDFDENYKQIEGLLYDAVHNLKYSKINLIYNHYYNMTTIEPVTHCIYPMEQKAGAQGYTGDFVVEGDIDELLENMILSYLSYEVRIAFINSRASENIIRQNATSQSLKKIEEKEEEQAVEERKIKNLKGFRKVIDSYMKKKSLGGELSK